MKATSFFSLVLGKLIETVRQNVCFSDERIVQNNLVSGVVV